jgi:hypothetical protein
MEGLGAVSRPKRQVMFKFFLLLPRILLWRVLFLLTGCVATAPAQTLPADLNTTGVEFGIYAHNSVQEIADCKVDRIFTDHRRMGFFHVQLFPLLVVQGVRMELADQNADGGWVDGFKSDWLPDIKHDGMEWRDVFVSVKTDGAPSIHADRAIPAAKGASAICKLENITLKARGDTWRVSRAELRDEAGRPRVVWRTGTDEFHWDLFTGEMADPSIQSKAQK